MKKTKIVATIGPSCDSEEKIRQLIFAGVNVFRFNTKHGDVSWHRERINRVKLMAQKLKISVGILLDLQGPEIRIGKFPQGQIELKKGEIICFSGQQEAEKTIVLSNLTVLRSLKKDQIVLIDDGFFKFEILKTAKDKVWAKVLSGGSLGSCKGVNLPGADLNLPSIIPSDLKKLDMAAKENVDFVALSFTRSKEDVILLRKEMEKRGVIAEIIAKIENKKSLDNFQEILAEADGIMVARGDLGVEIDLYQIPYWQKRIIGMCRDLGKPVITATQMLQSMIVCPKPTRAEVSDVANAVYDYTDAVMLSGETANGNFPLESVKIMAEIVSYTEDKRGSSDVQAVIDSPQKAVVKGAFNLYQGLASVSDKVKAFLVLSQTGTTARLLARYRPECPIIVLTENKKTKYKLMLNYGVFPNYLKFPEGTIHSLRVIFQYLVVKKMLCKGDQVVVVKGKHWKVSGGISTVSVETVDY